MSEPLSFYGWQGRCRILLFKKEKHHFWWCIGVLLFGAYCISSILPGEEMVLAISTESVISRDCIPSAKQVRRAREKQLITVFREAMSHVASRSRRVYRADDMRHKSGRGMRTPCANSISANLHISTRTSGFGFVRSTKKETDTLLWCLSLFLVTRSITRSNTGSCCMKMLRPITAFVHNYVSFKRDLT